MKYVDEFRNQDLAQNLLLRLRALVTRPWVVMEVCGGPDALYCEVRPG